MQNTTSPTELRNIREAAQFLTRCVTFLGYAYGDSDNNGELYEYVCVTTTKPVINERERERLVCSTFFFELDPLERFDCSRSNPLFAQMGRNIISCTRLCIEALMYLYTGICV